jgi:putative hydrolase of the HAD superfamily
MKPYDLLFWDADGTLFDYDRSEVESFRLTFQQFGLDFNPAIHLPFYKKINAVCWKEYEQHLISIEALHRQRFRKFISEMKMDPDPDQFGDAYLSHLACQSHLIENARCVISELSKKYEMTMITNGFTEIQKKRLKVAGLDRYFKTVVVSQEAGVSKPDPLIFEIAMERSGRRDKSSVLMIGDGYNSDICGGVQFGIDTCWFTPEQLNLNPPAVWNYRIFSLNELIPLLLS